MVERERRWLCRNVPRERALRTEAITDLYVSGTRLRLREARPIGGDPADAPAGSKANVDPHTRPITSIYLPEEEFAVLVGDPPGLRIHKLRLVSCCRSMRFRTILPSSSW